MFRHLLLIISLVFLAPCLRSQTYIGLRGITNFSKQDYNGGAQSWNILQDRQGTMYFANNEGVLRFDGVYWQLFPLANKTIVRSMQFGKDNRIYVGGQDELGYFSPGNSGRLAFTSLKNLIPPDQQKFADIWDITLIREEVFFRASQKIFRYSQGKIEVYSQPGYWLFMGKMAGKLIAQHDQMGLVTYSNGSWQPVVPASELPPGYFRKMVEFGPDTTLAIGSSGSYLITGNQITPFTIHGLASDQRVQYSDIIATDQDLFVLGTYSDGFYLLNKTGKIIEHFSRKEGLQNSNVRCLFRDRGGNLWLGLDSGIDFIAFNNSVKQINPAIFNGGAGYGVAQQGDRLYFAMSNGLFALPLPNLRDFSFAPDKFRQVSGGQTWSVSVLEDMVLSGRDEGFYKIEREGAVPVVRNPGYWTFQPLQQGDRSMIVAGNYEGISFFEYKGAAIVAAGKVRDFHESARFIVIDNNNDIWMSHPYRGVYKINVSNGTATGVKLFTQDDGLPSSLNNHVYRIKNRVVVATEKGIYEYSPADRRFAPSPYFREIFGDNSIRYLKEDQSGNIWFVQEKNIGVVDFSKLKPGIIYFPELQGRILSGFESIYPLNDNNVFVGGEKGFYHINFQNYRENNQALDVFIRQVSTSGRFDSVLFGGYGRDINAAMAQQESQRPSLSQQNSSVHFEYSSPLYDQVANLEYSYRLHGFDKTWSQWSKKAEKDYTSLPPGDYIFSVKVRNNLMGESKAASFSFVVMPPWYRSTWAMFFYTLMAAWIGYLLYRKQKKNLLKERAKHQEEQRKLAYLHQLELEKSEKELVKLKNDKLETEIEFKNSELATTAMHLVQKGELLVKIKDELQHLTKAAKDKAGTTEVKKLIRILNEEDKLQEEWEQFSVHFDKVHSDYLVTLKSKYPGLSAHELKLCAYLRMNLSSKEIAQLMSISVRGVEISRYRLRKKLAIPTETNLFQFLFDIQKNNMSS